MAAWWSPRSWFSGRVKASEAQRIILRLVQHSDLTLPLNTFERMTREGFERNVTVYACVMEIARACAGIPWMLLSTRSVGTRKRLVKTISLTAAAKAAAKGQRKAVQNAEIEDHKLLRLLEVPNPMEGGGAFMERAVAFWQLHGNSYIERAGPSQGPPRELWTLRPDRVTIRPGDTPFGIVGAYLYGEQDDPRPQSFEPQQVLHLKCFSPGDDLYGLSPLMVAARAVDQDNEAAKWNWSILKNSGRPSGAFVTEQYLNPVQVEQVRAEVKRSITGAQNAGRPAILHGGLDYKHLALTPAEVEWLEGRKISKLEICQAFGVPGELIGDTDHKTYQNYKEARSAFYQETILPLMDRLRDDLNRWLTPQFGDNLRLDYDRDQIEALAEDQAALWDRLERATFLRVNEKRAAAGYDEDPDGDVLLVSSALAPIDVVANPPAMGTGDAIDAELSDEGREKVKAIAAMLAIDESEAARVVRRLLLRAA